MLNALSHWLVSTKSVEILVQEFVGRTLSVESLITTRFATVQTTVQAIHSFVANLSLLVHKSRSLKNDPILAFLLHVVIH